MESVKEQNNPELLDAWLDLAEAMLGCGAEITRVERTLTRLGAGYGATGLNAFTLNSSISVTCRFQDNEILTQIRRIRFAPSTDLALLEDLNELSRRACREHLSAKELKDGVRKLKAASVNRLWYPAGFLSAFSFVLFFGGRFSDAAVSGLFGLLTCFCLRTFSRLSANTVVTNALTSFTAGFLVRLLCAAVPSLHDGMIIIGIIMLMIPGLAITNSMRDIMVGDTISGTMRFVESLLWAGALALGFISSMLITGGIL